jgi:DNA mismatch repair protein MutS2
MATLERDGAHDPADAYGPWPDLLFPGTAPRVDAAHLVEAMTFAFASGVSGGLFQEALERASVGASTFTPGAFARDLFLDDLAARCFRVRAEGREHAPHRGYLLRVLAHPPADPAVVDFRRAILGELAGSPELRRATERLYALLVRFRALLEGATASKKWDSTRRQLDLLGVAKQLFDHLARAFAGATSGLARLAAFGAAVHAGEPYRSLADLLAYDDELATVDVRVRVGADGRVRGFSILRLEENRGSVFAASPARRWLARFELAARGYKLGEGEVMARLLDAVFEGLEGDLVKLFQLLGDLEVYLGALGMRDLAEAAGLEVCLPELATRKEEGRALVRLWNPLLVAHGIPAVPCDLFTDRLDTTVLVTGPNSGGKTRLLQSVGLAQLLGQAGLFVPARAARILPVPSLVVSLLQETRADQSEGRLGMELVRIRALFELLPPGAMVLLDELCSGTNPSEGEEIFELVVSLLSELAPQAFITTHFLSFAAGLEVDRRVPSLRFLQVDLDAEQRPTYQFTPGVAGTSLAARAAERLGVTRDELLSLVTRSRERAVAPPPAGGTP